MSQGALSIPDTDGTTFLSNLNAAVARLASRASGTARPSDIATYEIWVDTDTPGGGVASVYMYDGTNDVRIGWIDTTNHLFIAANDVQATSIASASTTDIGAAVGKYVKVTGTTSITALGTVQAGTIRVVEFTGALTLTHNATSLILPGAANITTAAGDCAIFVSEGSGNWRCAVYQKADGTAVAGSGLAVPVVATYATNADLSTHIPYDDTPPQNTEGTQIFSQSFTANNAAHRVRVTFDAFGTNGAGPDYNIAALFLDSGADAVKADAQMTVSNEYPAHLHLVYEAVVSAGAHTWAIRVGAASSTMRLNGTTSARRFGGVAAASLTIEELPAP